MMLHLFIISLLLFHVSPAPQLLPDEINKNLQNFGNPASQVLDGLQNEFGQVSDTIFKLQNTFRLGNIVHPLVSGFDNLADGVFKNSFGLFAKSVESANKFSNLGGLLSTASENESNNNLRISSVSSTKSTNSENEESKDIRR
ncbi:hypothetical protein FQR65_LT07487 [Abscondita terminalis]|nr:hypothetical protein FQR65_LT07487 [Abscondita terminalis]